MARLWWNQCLVPDHWCCVCSRGQRRIHHVWIVLLFQHDVIVRCSLGEQWKLRRKLFVHRTGGFRWPHRERYAERYWSILAPTHRNLALQELKRARSIDRARFFTTGTRVQRRRIDEAGGLPYEATQHSDICASSQIPSSSPQYASSASPADSRTLSCDAPSARHRMIECRSPSLWRTSDCA
jgi:hypothetical protein